MFDAKLDYQNLDNLESYREMVNLTMLNQNLQKKITEQEILRQLASGNKGKMIWGKKIQTDVQFTKTQSSSHQPLIQNHGSKVSPVPEQFLKDSFSPNSVKELRNESTGIFLPNSLPQNMKIGLINKEKFHRIRKTGSQFERMDWVTFGQLSSLISLNINKFQQIRMPEFLVEAKSNFN